MGTQKNGIVILGIVLAIVVVLYIAFRNFKVGDLLGIGKAQEDFDKWAKGVESGFNEWWNSVFTTDPHSKLAGKQVTLENGDVITIPEDNIVNPDGTVEGSPPTLDINEDDENILTNLFAREKNLRKVGQSKIERLGLSDDEVFQVNQLAQEFTKINIDKGDLFDSQGFRLPEFSGSARDVRALNVYLDDKRGAFKNTATGKTIRFGGFESASKQEQALHDAIRKSRLDNPEFFKSLDEKRRQALRKKKA